MPRTPARWLAPLALMVCAVAVLLILSSGSGSSGESEQPPAATGPPATTKTTAKKPRQRKSGRSYTVAQGDVLSAIAEKTGVALEDIQKLNPDVDAQSLHAGQKLKLAP